MAFTPPAARPGPAAPHDLPFPSVKPPPAVRVKPTPGKTPVPGKTVLPPPKAKRPSYTPAQEATLHAKQLLAPLYSQADVQAKRQNDSINAYTQAVMQALGGVAPQIGQDYNTQINAQSQMVNNAADSLRAVNPTGDVQHLLDAVGAPAAQGQQIAGNLNNTFNGGAAVGQYVNGVSPLGALRSQGLAAESLARLQPGFTALAGRQSLLSALAQQSDARAKIAENQPKLEQDWLSQFQSNKAKQQQLALESNALGLKTQKQGFDQSLAVSKQNLAASKFSVQQKQFLSRQAQQINEFNARQTSANAKLALPNASLSGKLGYLVDATGNPVTRNGKLVVLPGSRIVNGRVVKAGAKGKAAPRLSAYQVQKFRGAAESIALNAKNGFNGKDPVTGQPKTYPPLTLAQAWEEMRKHGVPETIAIAALRRIYKVQDNGVAIGANVNPTSNPKALGPPAP